MEDLRVDTLKRWLEWAVDEQRDPDESRQKLLEKVTPLGRVAVWEVSQAIARRDQADLRMSTLEYCLLYRRHELREFSLQYFGMLAALHGKEHVVPSP